MTAGVRNFSCDSGPGHQSTSDEVSRVAAHSHELVTRRSLNSAAIEIATLVRLDNHAEAAGAIACPGY